MGFETYLFKSDDDEFVIFEVSLWDLKREKEFSTFLFTAFEVSLWDLKRKMSLFVFRCGGFEVSLWDLKLVALFMFFSLASI